MAFTEIYVDPSINANSGTGTSGDPYGDLQYALNSSAFDTTNGTRINIKAGTAEILTAVLSLTTFVSGGGPTGLRRLVFQGYTSAAGDGGMGAISGNSTYTIMNDNTQDNITFIDMILHSVGTGPVVRLDNDCAFYNCEIYGATAGNGLQADDSLVVANCYLHDIGWVDIIGANDVRASFNYIVHPGPTASIQFNSGDGVAEGNVIEITANGDGILLANDGIARHNTVYATGSNGDGIFSGNQVINIIQNNYVEGFSGGGQAFSVGSGGAVGLFAGNRYYNNATHVNWNGAPVLLATDNSATTASGLTNPGSGDFSPTSEIAQAGGWPGVFKGLAQNTYPDIGAIQKEIIASGGGGRRPHLRKVGV